jgi:dsDNA-specific endonuclease/ATPase MutS2
MRDGQRVSIRPGLNIKENILASVKESLGLHKFKQLKPWVEEECSGFLDQRKQAKMQWLQDQYESNLDNMNNIRHEASTTFQVQKEGISDS